MSHCGYLTKQGHVFKNWKKRYFVLDDSILTYFDKKGGTAKGYFTISPSTTIQEKVVSNRDTICLENKTKNESLILQADAKDKSHWLVELRKATVEPIPKSSEPTVELKGSCSCGGVLFEVTCKPMSQITCHCMLCQKWTAQPSMDLCVFSDKSLTITNGKDLVETVNLTPAANRMRCKQCGTCLMNKVVALPLTSVNASCLSEFNFQSTMHLHYVNKTNPVIDGIPKYKDMPVSLGGSGEMLADDFNPVDYYPIVLVVGASGNIGAATVRALANKDQSCSKVRIRAGVRDIGSGKCAPIQLPLVELVEADMNQPATLLEAMKDASTVFIVTPSAENRTDLALAALEACKQTTSVNHVVILSVQTAQFSATVFGDQFKPLEAAVLECGLNYTIIRLPFFVDNYFAQADIMKEKGQFFSPLPATFKHNDVYSGDVGEAVANMLVTPSLYENQVLPLTGPLFSELDVASAFTEAFGSTVEYVQAPYEEVKQSLLAQGIPEWQVEGIIELYQFIEAKEDVLCEEFSNLQEILGRPCTTIRNAARHFVCPETFAHSDREASSKSEEV